MVKGQAVKKVLGLQYLAVFSNGAKSREAYNTHLINW